MKLKIDRLSFYGLTDLLGRVCACSRRLREQSGEGPQGEEQQELARCIGSLSEAVMCRYSRETSAGSQGQALLSLMEAYEMTSENSVLDFALRQAETLLPHLPGDPLKCRLLMYCYYYTEASECEEEARRLLEGWDPSVRTPEMSEAAACYKELV